ncbi:unnamed protein product [Lupinus luteus]|uniref:RNase H type-1 domain-containing protein n=1 Tax=Lupinus luteus TaxID=3873 RepID=A0AAV1YLZ1_LUPLU
MVLDNTPWTLQEVFRKFSTSYADEERYGLASSRMILDRASPWLPPPAGWTKLNVDGGLTSLTSTRSGEILRDENGFWITGFSCREGHGDSFLAELLVTLRGLNLAWFKVCFSNYGCMGHHSSKLGSGNLSCSPNSKSGRLATLTLDNKDMNSIIYDSPPIQIIGFLHLDCRGMS